MANLKKQSDNPARVMTWGGKSLANCSRRELIECVVYMARQVAIAEGQKKAPATIPPQVAQGYNVKEAAND